jgi:hypothetical protein
MNLANLNVMVQAEAFNSGFIAAMNRQPSIPPVMYTDGERLDWLRGFQSACHEYNLYKKK